MQLFTLTFSIMWSVYAGRGYARHQYYLRPEQRSDAGMLSVISRSCCIMAIATGKISVAFLIQRIQGPSKWRTWFLRFCSISVFVTALFAVIFLFAQCQPARALWTPSMFKNGTGHCWNPIPVNNYDIVIAGMSFPSYLRICGCAIDTRCQATSLSLTLHWLSCLLT